MNQKLKDSGQAGVRVSFCDVPSEMVEAAYWVLDEFSGEVSRATLVSQLLEGILGAAPSPVRRELCKFAKSASSAPISRRRHDVCLAGLREKQK